MGERYSIAHDFKWLDRGRLAAIGITLTPPEVLPVVRDGISIDTMTGDQEVYGHYLVGPHGASVVMSNLGWTHNGKSIHDYTNDEIEQYLLKVFGEERAKEIPA